MPRITIRVTQAELDEVKRLAGRESTACENVSEYTRLLYKRESNKSLGLEKPENKDIATAFRVGRPMKVN